MPLSPNTRRWWLFAARVVVSAAMLWVLVRKIAGVPFSDLAPEWTPAAVGWAVIAAALTFAGVWLSAARWRQVLHEMSVPAEFGRLVSYYFAGQFVSNVLPTTIGGDVLRVSRLSADTGDNADSFASVVIERITGWVVLPLLTFVGLAADPSLLADGQAGRLAAGIAAALFTVLCCTLYAANHPRLAGRFAEREGWQRFIGAVHLGVAKIKRRPKAGIRIVAVGVAYQFTLVLAAWAAAACLGMAGTVSFTALLAFIPAVLIVQVAPIGIGGLGVREGVLAVFLAPLGVPASQAGALGLALFGLNLVVSLCGAPSFAAGRRDEQGHVPITIP